VNDIKNRGPALFLTLLLLSACGCAGVTARSETEPIRPLPNMAVFSAVKREMPATVAVYSTISSTGSRLSPSSYPGVLHDVTGYLKFLLKPKYAPGKHFVLAHAILVHAAPFIGRARDIAYLPMHVADFSLFFLWAGGDDPSIPLSLAIRPDNTRAPGSADDAKRFVHELMQKLLRKSLDPSELDAVRRGNIYVVTDRNPPHMGTPPNLLPIERTITAYISDSYVMLQFFPARLSQAQLGFAPDHQFAHIEDLYAAGIKGVWPSS